MLQNLKNLISIEPKFQFIIDIYGLPEIKSRPQGFEALVQLILEQQVSIASAEATFKKIETKTNKVTPENIVLFNEKDWKNCGVSRQKTTYINNLAEQILNKSFQPQLLEHLTEKEAFQELIKLKGIGTWTAEVYLMFCLQKEDVFPVKDIAIQRIMTELFSCDSIEDMLLKAELWRPYRTLASFTLWHYYLGERNRLKQYK